MAPPYTSNTSPARNVERNSVWLRNWRAHSQIPGGPILGPIFSSVIPFKLVDSATVSSPDGAQSISQTPEMEPPPHTTVPAGILEA